VAGEETLGAHEDSGVMVVGLHTCGDLAASVIRSFEVCVCVSLSLSPPFSLSLCGELAAAAIRSFEVCVCVCVSPSLPLSLPLSLWRLGCFCHPLVSGVCVCVRIQCVCVCVCVCLAN